MREHLRHPGGLSLQEGSIVMSAWLGETHIPDTEARRALPNSKGAALQFEDSGRLLKISVASSLNISLVFAKMHAVVCCSWRDSGVNFQFQPVTGQR